MKIITYETRKDMFMDNPMNREDLTNWLMTELGLNDYDIHKDLQKLNTNTLNNLIKQVTKLK